MAERLRLAFLRCWFVCLMVKQGQGISCHLWELMGGSSMIHTLLRLKQDMAITTDNHIHVITAPSPSEMFAWWIIVVNEGKHTNCKAPNGEWLFRRDSALLEPPECLVQWKESILHYAWQLLFSSHGAVSRHCRSCTISTNCSCVHRLLFLCLL